MKVLVFMVVSLLFSATSLATADFQSPAFGIAETENVSIGTPQVMAAGAQAQSLDDVKTTFDLAAVGSGCLEHKETDAFSPKNDGLFMLSVIADKSKGVAAPVETGWPS